MQYASPTADTLSLAATGSGDIAEMTESLGEDAAYAYVRMKLGNDEYSERVKFAFVVWQGKSFIPITILFSFRRWVSFLLAWIVKDFLSVGERMFV